MKKYNEIMRKKLSEQYSKIAEKKQQIKNLKQLWNIQKNKWMNRKFLNLTKYFSSMMIKDMIKKWLEYIWYFDIWYLIDIILMKKI